MERHEPRYIGHVLTWVALLALTALTFALSFADLGALEVVVALAIATAKATLVALFFMHLLEAKGLSRVVLFTSALFVVLLVSLMVADVATRDEDLPGAPGIAAQGH